MTVLPELEHTLRDAAARRQRVRLRPRQRPRRPQLLEVLLPLALAAGAVALALVFVAPGLDPERSAATPSPARPASGTLGLLGQVYGVFARPRAPTDRLPDDLDRRLVQRSGISVRFDESRRVATTGDQRAWAAPALDGGQPALCAFVAGERGGVGCGRFDLGSSPSPRNPGSAVLRPGTAHLLMVPDGIREIRLESPDAPTLRRPVRDNAVLIGPGARARTARWATGAGTPLILELAESPDGGPVEPAWPVG